MSEYVISDLGRIFPESTRYPKEVLLRNAKDSKTVANTITGYMQAKVQEHLKYYENRDSIRFRIYFDYFVNADIFSNFQDGSYKPVPYQKEPSIEVIPNYAWAMISSSSMEPRLGGTNIFNDLGVVRVSDFLAELSELGYDVSLDNDISEYSTISGDKLSLIDGDSSRSDRMRHDHFKFEQPSISIILRNKKVVRKVCFDPETGVLGIPINEQSDYGEGQFTGGGQKNKA